MTFDARSRRPTPGKDWTSPWVNAEGAVLHADASDSGAKIAFSTDAGYDYVHPVRVVGAAPYEEELVCRCGAPNPDGACTTGRLTKPFFPASEEQLRFREGAWSGAGGDARPMPRAPFPRDSVADYLSLRAAPRPLQTRR